MPLDAGAGALETGALDAGALAAVEIVPVFTFSFKELTWYACTTENINSNTKTTKI